LKNCEKTDSIIVVFVDLCAVCLNVLLKLFKNVRFVVCENICVPGE